MKEIKQSAIKKIPLDKLKEAPWNPRRFTDEIMNKLRTSFEKNGYVEKIVVWERDDFYMVINGNHRLRVLKEFGVDPVECIVEPKESTEEEVMLLSQTLNNLQDEDDPEKKKTMFLAISQVMSLEEMAQVTNESEEQIEAFLADTADFGDIEKDVSDTLAIKQKKTYLFDVDLNEVDVVNEVLRHYEYNFVNLCRDVREKILN